MKKDTNSDNMTVNCTNLGQSAASFIFDVEKRVCGIENVLLLQGRVKQTGYSDALFQRFDIDLPTKLATAVDVRKADFLAGRLMLKVAQIEMGLSDEPINIGENRAPIWPDDQRGSVSHTHGHVACILTGNTNLSLGVDIEKVASGKALAALRQQVLCKSERDLIDATKNWSPDALATLIFSAKETLFKALYPQINTFFGFNAARVQDAPRADYLILKLTRSLGSKYQAEQNFAVRFRLNQEHILTWLSVSS